MASEIIRKLYDYYKSREEEFLQNVPGKFLVISDNLKIYAMDTDADAYKLGCAAFGLGHFLIQEVKKEEPEFNGFVCMVRKRKEEEK